MIHESLIHTVMETIIESIGEQAKLLLENDPWVSEKLDLLKTEEEKCRFLAIASMYALSKVRRQ